MIDNKDLIGNRYLSKNYGWAELIDYKGYFNCVLKFDNTGAIVSNISKQHLSTGEFKDPMYPIVYGIGYMGIGDYKSRDNNKQKTKAYNTWNDILERCYKSDNNVKNNSYFECSVAEEWHNFQNFAKWHQENFDVETMQGWCLDKDILVRGNKVYSSETCCFVPNEVNMLFMKTTGIYTGVRQISPNRWLARVNKKNIRLNVGTFKTENEAILAYKEEKERYIKEIVNKYKDVLPLNTYETLINYKL